MLAPGVLFLLAFVAYPFFYGIFLSLQDRPVAKPGVFVGLGNFVTLAHDAVFWQVDPQHVRLHDRHHDPEAAAAGSPWPS